MFFSVFSHICVLALGLVLLVAGGNHLVSQARRLAQILSTPPILIGLTIVALGTSLPEIFLSVQAALLKDPQLALGNVVGSNITNILLVISIPALIRPLREHHPTLARDLTVMTVVSVAFFLLCLTDNLNRWAGIFLLSLVPAHMALLYATTPSAVFLEKHATKATSWMALATIVMILLSGGLILPLGAYLAVYGSTQLAFDLGVPTGIIGLSVLAFGTSLPEITVTIIATVRRTADMALGNIIGSNIANILLAAGIASLITPLPSAFFLFDVWAMGLATLAFVGVAFLQVGFSRFIGCIFLVSYFLYMTTVYLRVDPL